MPLHRRALPCHVGAVARQRRGSSAPPPPARPQTAPPFLPRTKSCSEPFPGRKLRRFCPRTRPRTLNGSAYCYRLLLPDTQAATPCREPWCVLPRRPKSRAALRCQADERTAPSQPTGPKVAPSRFTASTSRALLRGGCGATVRRSAAGGGRQTRARRASIPAASWVARRPPAAFGWGASPLGWAAAQLLHLWGLVGAPPRPPPPGAHARPRGWGSVRRKKAI